MRWPHLRRLMPSRASCGFAAATADDVAPGWIGVDAEQEVGRGEVEEADSACDCTIWARLMSRRRSAPAGGGSTARIVIDGLRGGYEVAHRADAADARHDGRHLVHGSTLGDALEATELRDVEAGVSDLALLIELDGDLGVALDAGDRIDDDGAAHGDLPQRPNRVRRGLRRAAGEQVVEQRVDEVSRGRAAGQEDVDLDDLVHRRGHGQQRRDDLAGQLRSERGVLDVGAVQHGCTPMGLRMPGTLEVTAQSPKATSIFVRSRTSLILWRSSSLETAPSTRQTSTPSGNSLTSTSGP